MTTANATLKTLAYQIADAQAHENMMFYVLLGALAVIGIATSSLVAAVFDARGKLSVTNANFETALLQLKRSTEGVETIKTRISHQDWTLKEVKSLRLKKLEQLVTDVYATLQSQEINGHFEQTDASENGEKAKQHMSVVRQLTSLYFPELGNETGKFFLAFGNFNIWRIEHRAIVQKAGAEYDYVRKKRELAIQQRDIDAAKAAKVEQRTAVDALIAAKSRYADEFSAEYKKLVDASEELNARAADLMKEMLTIPALQ